MELSACRINCRTKLLPARRMNPISTQLCNELRDLLFRWWAEGKIGTESIVVANNTDVKKFGALFGKGSDALINERVFC
jgi:hypothetical protein